jgi:hypothetical protein
MFGRPSTSDTILFVIIHEMSRTEEGDMSNSRVLEFRTFRAFTLGHLVDVFLVQLIMPDRSPACINTARDARRSSKA